jgi:hypothetical protein
LSFREIFLYFTVIISIIIPNKRIIATKKYKKISKYNIAKSPYVLVQWTSFSKKKNLAKKIKGNGKHNIEYHKKTLINLYLLSLNHFTLKF